jgi:hypothetical protein
MHSQKTDVEVCVTVRGSGNVGSKLSPRSEPLTVKYRPGPKRKAETQNHPLSCVLREPWRREE